jgi:hypothetical protein
VYEDEDNVLWTDYHIEPIGAEWMNDFYVGECRREQVVLTFTSRFDGTSNFVDFLPPPCDKCNALILCSKHDHYYNIWLEYMSNTRKRLSTLILKYV